MRSRGERLPTVVVVSVLSKKAYFFFSGLDSDSGSGNVRMNSRRMSVIVLPVRSLSACMRSYSISGNLMVIRFCLVAIFVSLVYSQYASKIRLMYSLWSSPRTNEQLPNRHDYCGYPTQKKDLKRVPIETHRPFNLGQKPTHA